MPYQTLHTSEAELDEAPFLDDQRYARNTKVFTAASVLALVAAAATAALLSFI